MNKSFLTLTLGIPEDKANEVLKKYNEDLSKVRAEAAEAKKFEDAIKKSHIGYLPDNDVPEPKSPEEAIKQLIVSVQSTLENNVKIIMGEHSKSIVLLRRWAGQEGKALPKSSTLLKETVKFLSSPPKGYDKHGNQLASNKSG